MLSPSGWAVQTPPELQPWGWTSLDILVAPIMSALFATLTHSQSVWRDAHVQATSYMNYGALIGNITTSEKPAGGGPTTAPFDEESARAICAIILMGLFSGRAVRNFGGLPALSKLIGMGGSLCTLSLSLATLCLRSDPGFPIHVSLCAGPAQRKVKIQ